MNAKKQLGKKQRTLGENYSLFKLYTCIMQQH